MWKNPEKRSRMSTISEFLNKNTEIHGKKKIHPSRIEQLKPDWYDFKISEEVWWVVVPSQL